MDPDYYRWTQWIFLKIFNAWYDRDAVRPDGGLGRARPISELVEEYASGARPLPADDGRDWADLSSVEQADIVDSHRLAYASEAPVNWAPGLGSVVANEEVTNDGRSERGNFPVFKRNLRQWMMRITDYSDRLADDLDRVQWPDKVKAMQRNWIGRSHGARVAFPVVGAAEGSEPIEVFTTRPDTLFGATFMVLAPEHPLVDSLVPPGEWAPGTNPAWTGGEPTPEAAVTAYRRAASRKSDVERQIEGKDKTGVFTGAYAVNPATGAQVPVFVADYVLMGYGTGAIMAVPGQDERDWHFADNFDLPEDPHGAAERGPPGGRGVHRRGAGDQLRQRLDRPQRQADRRGQGRDDRLARRARPRRGDGELQAARLAVLAAALLGRAVPDPLRHRRCRPRRARVDAARRAARGARLQPAHVRPRGRAS